MTSLEFKCPRCSGHAWGSHDGIRYCRSNDYTWGSLDDYRHFREVRTFANHAEFDAAEKAARLDQQARLLGTTRGL